MADTSEDIYVDLFSNSSLDMYPSNRVSSFTVKLDRPVQLEGNYECALAQMISPNATEISTHGSIIVSTFPESIKQKTDGVVQDNVVPFTQETMRNIFRPKRPEQYPVPTYTPADRFLSNRVYSFTHNVPEDKVFTSGEEVVTYINNLLQGKESSHNDVFNEVIKQRTYSVNAVSESSLRYISSFEKSVNKTLRVLHRDYDVSVAISGALGRILGFNLTDEQWVVFEQPGLYQFTRTVDINSSRPTLLSVYTNVILPHRVGDTSAPLIRACTVPSQVHVAGEFLNFEFDSLHYLPVALKFIQEIQVEVRGNDGSLIPFEAGILYVRLHFRPRRQR